MSKGVICLANTEPLAETHVQRLKQAGSASGIVSVQVTDNIGSRDFEHEHKAPDRGAAVAGFFNKLPGFHRSPPGLERQVLRLLPRLLVLGTLLLGFPSLLARLYPWDGSETLVAMRVASIDFYMVSAIILHWRIVFTVAIAAFIVMVMKGPAYVADAYPLEDAETPDAAKSASSAKLRNSPGHGS